MWNMICIDLPVFQQICLDISVDNKFTLLYQSESQSSFWYQSWFWSQTIFGPRPGLGPNPRLKLVPVPVSDPIPFFVPALVLVLEAKFGSNQSKVRWTKRSFFFNFQYLWFVNMFWLNKEFYGSIRFISSYQAG